MLADAKELLKQAQKGGYAIPAVDYANADMLKWFMETADGMKMPLILSLAQVHITDAFSLNYAADIAMYFIKRKKAPVALHLDHGTDFAIVKQAIECGFNSVMIDASMKSFDENVAITKEVVAYAHSKGVHVEAELGHVGQAERLSGKDNDTVFTEPQDVSAFVKKTGVDYLAVSIGTAHGLYKGVPKINFDRLKEIREASDIPLVLHGGSSSGDENLRKSAEGGITKVNLFSDFLLWAKNETQNLDSLDYFEVLAAQERGMKNCLSHYYQVLKTASF